MVTCSLEFSLHTTLRVRLTSGIKGCILRNHHETNKLVDASISCSWVSDRTIRIIQICSTGLPRLVRPYSVVIQTVPMKITSHVTVS